jgi:oxygen-independent coproporphyrinogen III oxidase
MPSPASPLSLYLHIPFCTHRCAYCDFNTYAGQESMIPAYVDALRREIAFAGSRLPSPGSRGRGAGRDVHTIFFGGGTPSLLSPAQFSWIFESIHDHFTLADDAEITIEANPGTVSYRTCWSCAGSASIASAMAFNRQTLKSCICSSGLMTSST